MAKLVHVDQRCSYYEILGLSSPQPGSVRLSTEDIKKAYHKALLRHHPDKSTVITGEKRKPQFINGTTKNSVDDIILAYKTLSNPSTRTEYDRSLSQREGLLFGRSTQAGRLHPGSETIDLDDLSFDEEKSVWYGGCRCGNEKGFMVTEAELEEGAVEGEVVVACKGCSLWLQVEFEAADGNGPDEEISPSR